MMSSGISLSLSSILIFPTHILFPKMQENFNMISVVICTYNQEEVIARAIESVIRQKSLWPIEIIIGDDHSSDATAEICRRYEDAYPYMIRFYRNSVNKGIVENYFSCLSRCRGKYIADLAGDDEWSDDMKLEKERKFLESHPEVVMVHTDYLLRYHDSGTTAEPAKYPFPKTPRGGKEVALDIFRQRYRPLAHLCTSMYRNDAFVRCRERYPRYFSGMEYPCEDVQLTVLMAFEGKIAYLEEKTLYYTVSEGSISNPPDERKAMGFKKGVLRLMADLADSVAIPQKDFSLSVQFRVFELLMHTFRLYDKGLRRELLVFLSERGIKVYGIRNRVILFLTSSGLLWRGALALRKIIKGKGDEKKK